MKQAERASSAHEEDPVHSETVAEEPTGQCHPLLEELVPRKIPHPVPSFDPHCAAAVCLCILAMAWTGAAG